MQVHMHQDGMKLSKLLVALVVSFLFFQCVSFFMLTTTCRAGVPITLYVGAGEEYHHIQDAIDNASAGYRIFVYNGTYYENITIDKRIDLFGEDRSITIINGNGTDTVITITANNVNISHFTIKNGGSTRNDCIIQVNGASSIITDTIISNGYYGIYLNHSGDHLIYDNIIRNNRGDGISLNRSDSNVNISFNTLTSNNNGISVYSSDNNGLYNNIIQHNNANGIFLNRSSTTNTIADNNCSYNNYSGLYLNDYSDHSTLFHNQVFQNSQSGITLENCSWANISHGNTVESNYNYGIMIVGSHNSIQNNTIIYNRKDGMYLSADNDNTISSNTIGYNTRAGIRLYNSTADEISIVDDGKKIAFTGLPERRDSSRR